MKEKTKVKDIGRAGSDLQQRLPPPPTTMCH